MDGTFADCTKFFLHLFKIHGFFNAHYIPLIFCLQPNKEERTYKKLFEILVEICSEKDMCLCQKILLFTLKLVSINAHLHKNLLIEKRRFRQMIFNQVRKEYYAQLIISLAH